MTTDPNGAFAMKAFFPLGGKPSEAEDLVAFADSNVGDGLLELRVRLGIPPLHEKALLARRREKAAFHFCLVQREKPVEVLREEGGARNDPNKLHGLIFSPVGS